MDLMIVPEDGTKLDVLAMRYRAAFDRTEHGRKEWIEGTLELTIVIAEARKHLPDHREYNRWLERHGLRKFSKDDLTAFNGMAKDLTAARTLLEQTNGSSLAWAWRHRPNKPIVDPSERTHKGPLSRTSGSSKRKRALRIPTVMQHADDELAPKRETDWKQPERKAVVIRGLTREQVDPDFKGTSLEFATEYGHVNLHTKAEIEHNKRQERLSRWLGAMADFESGSRAVLATLEALDQETLREWRSKPGKAAKLQAWYKSIELACEKLRDIGKN